MPVYAYTCRDCGTPLEVHQEFSDAALTVCPVCGGALRKQYGSIGVTFNGSGFYRTDSRAGSGGSDTAKPESKGDGGSKSDGAKSEGGSKSDAAKPATASSSSGSSSGSSTASGSSGS
ncbi:FmdB family zinc ribbon protein [uncultured Amnibacterium sp.]|uniref:FmdB family zinc ribbon protein n=1 Tax=uncultured Amnibacterium sp. TaxID=1631851 RepID=UPI0035CA3BC3